MIQETANGLVVKVRIQPNAKKNKIAGVYGDSIKICICSPPVDGAANSSCMKYLSRLLGISKSKIEIITGEKSRNKTLRIRGISKEILTDILNKE